MSDVPTVNNGNAPVRTMCCGATHTHTKNAHRAAGNLLISANYFSRATERFCVSASEIKDRGSRISFFVLLSQKLIRIVIIGPRRLTTQVALSLIPT